MAFGQDFLRSFFGNDYVRDYDHASKTFRTNGYENAPRLKFLFHVYFNLNTAQIPSLRQIFNSTDQTTVGLLVKNIDLPKFRLDVDTLIQYNRKRLVQKKIEYQPILIKFHDDGGDLIRTLWYNYYAYYYKDPNQPYNGLPSQNGSGGPSAITSTGFDYNGSDIYAPSRQVNDWGYIGEAYQDSTQSDGGKPAFFSDISIYGFNQHKFVQYTLINPLITEWSHDQYNYAEDAGIMENTVQVSYETVKYYTGAIGGVRPDTNVPGFADPKYYDQIQSPLTRPGGTASVLGQGGLLDTGVGIVRDLQQGNLMGVIGAVQKAGRAYQTFRKVDFKDVIKEEALGAVKDVLRNATNGRSPTPASLPSILTRPIFPRPGGPTALDQFQNLGNRFNRPGGG